MQELSGTPARRSSPPHGLNTDGDSRSPSTVPSPTTADPSIGSQHPVTVSACLVVRNEEPVIGRCLDSLRDVANEIIVVHDGPCEDRTVEIAQAAGCRVFVRPFVGNPEYQTVFAYEQSRGTWLLTLDADEFLSRELAAVIPELIRREEYTGWEFRWPMWDGVRYITTHGPYKLSLFKRSETSLVGHLQCSEQVRGRIGRRDETLHHQPLYNNFTLRSVARKWRRWCRIQARELVEPFSDLPKFNYTGPDRWPVQRRVMNALSPVLAIPNGVAHFLLGILKPARDHTDVSVRLAFYQGIYATLLQLYVARYMYLERPAARARMRRGNAGVSLESTQPRTSRADAVGSSRAGMLPGMRYHLGCGERRIDGYINVDLQQTAATDLVMDLTRPSFPAAEPVSGVFSNAFFEHLRRPARVAHLKAVLQALSSEGFVCYLGLPDFRRVAELYLSGGPGIVGPHFDLFNVYRYTHGDPEMSPNAGWEAQLHKSLFDVPEIGRLLRDAGYPSYAVFRYVFPGEPREADLSLGFYAVARRVPTTELQQAARTFLSEFDGRFLELATLTFEDGRSLPRGVARVRALPPRKLVQRAAYGIAAVLARNTHPA